MSDSKYTVHGGAELDMLISSHMELLVSEVLAVAGSDILSAIVLGGGYGRGEGGVRISGGKEQLFNDYDVFLISKGLSRRKKSIFNKVFRELGVSLSSRFGIEVDFSPLKNKSDLSSLDYEMVWIEAKLGHIVLWGDSDVFDSIPSWRIDEMPVEEVARLLMNRGMGLLLAFRKIESGDASSEAREFVQRNAWKAVMAAGDAYLTLNGRYDNSYRKRRDNFIGIRNKMDSIPSELREFYPMSIDYKLFPPGDASGMEESRDLLVKAKEFLLAAQIEVASRMAGRVVTFGDMVANPPDISTCMGLKGMAKNCVLNLLHFKGGGRGASLFAHPRGRIFAAIPFFLGALDIDAGLIARLLGSSVGEREVLFDRLKKLWERFS